MCLLVSFIRLKEINDYSHRHCKMWCISVVLALSVVDTWVLSAKCTCICFSHSLEYMGLCVCSCVQFVYVHMHRMWQPLSKQRNHLIWVELQGEGSLSLVFHLFLFSFHNFFFMFWVLFAQRHFMCRLMWVMLLIAIRLKLAVLCFQKFQTFHYLSILGSVESSYNFILA